MNRKTFLSSLLALITAPFLGKSKEKAIIKPSDFDDLPARREFYRSALNPPKGGEIAGVHSSKPNNEVRLSGDFEVKGEDLIYIINRKR